VLNIHGDYREERNRGVTNQTLGISKGKLEHLTRKNAIPKSAKFVKSLPIKGGK